MSLIGFTILLKSLFFFRELTHENHYYVFSWFQVKKDTCTYENQVERP